MKIGMLGAGRIGGTLGQVWSERGHDVLYGVREESAGEDRRGTVAEAVAHGEIVVLALPWRAVQDVLTEAGDLGGKIVIDTTNGGGAGGRSGAEQIAEWAPGARVVKAFNQAGFETLRQPHFGDHAAVTFVAGDDAVARETVIGLGREIGLDMVDAGGLANAEMLERLASLWIELTFRQGLGRDWAFGLLRRSADDR
jgi:predicted dinucleotide-binding enzyme